MAIWNIEATYEYAAERIVADTEEEAYTIFLQDLNSHYIGTEEYKVEQLEECDECGEEIEFDCVCEKEGELADA